LNRLEVGWAVAKLQGRWFFPFLIKLPLVRLKKGSVTDDHIRRRLLATAGLDRAATDLQEGSSSPISSREGDSVPIPSKDREIPGIPSEGKDEISDEGERCAIRLTTQDKGFLADVWKHPTSTITGHYHSLGLSPRRGTGCQRLLVRRGLILSCPITFGHSRIKILSLTELGKAALGIHEADADRLGGPEHRYWKKRLAEDLRARGYDVTEEYPLGGGKAIDLVATRNGERVALEIETGKSDVLANVKKCLGAGLDKVILVATSRKTEEVAKTLAIQYPQVECVAAGNVVKTLASRFLVAGRQSPFAGGGTGTRTRISQYTMAGEDF
jgi:hypothetical protein